MPSCPVFLEQLGRAVGPGFICQQHQFVIGKCRRLLKCNCNFGQLDDALEYVGSDGVDHSHDHGNLGTVTVTDRVGRRCWMLAAGVVMINSTTAGDGSTTDIICEECCALSRHMYAADDEECPDDGEGRFEATVTLAVGVGHHVTCSCVHWRS